MGTSLALAAKAGRPDATTIDGAGDTTRLVTTTSVASRDGGTTSIVAATTFGEQNTLDLRTTRATTGSTTIEPTTHSRHRAINRSSGER